MSFEDIRKQLIEESKSQITELPEIAKSEMDQLVEKHEVHLREQLSKSIPERRFFEDGKGGVLIILRFPKKSVAVTEEEKKTGKKGLSGFPRVVKNNQIYWWGPQILLMGGSIATCFFENNEDNNEVIIQRGGLWEKENLDDTKDKIPLYLFRGKITRKDRWIEDKEAKKNHRAENTIVAEAKKMERYKGREIQTIYDIPDEDLDRPSYTFNITELVKVL